jgi:two-component system, OmpR family, sensor histidine kinase BaeS
MNTLTLKLSLAFTLVVLIAVGIMAFLVNQATTSEFGAYLVHQQAMGGMMGPGMGGMMGLIGEAERGFLDSLNRWLIVSGLVAIGLAFLIGLALARQILSPLRLLATATRRIATGDMTARVKVQSKDEIGQLSVDFNDMADALSRNQQLRRQMTADIAHELGTPLSVIQGNLEAMLDGVIPITPQRVASLHDQSLLLSRLISDLRQLSLAEAGQLKLNRSPTDLSSLVQHTVEAMQPSAQTAGVSLTVSLQPEMPKTVADPDRIAQVVHNLLTNSIRYSSEGGRILVKLEMKDRDLLQVSVSDNGSGILPEDLPRIFDRFYRADRSRTKATGGAGLGLAIAREIVNAHGGHIWAESQPTRGSTFLFTLPVSSSS